MFVYELKPLPDFFLYSSFVHCHTVGVTTWLRCKTSRKQTQAEPKVWRTIVAGLFKAATRNATFDTNNQECHHKIPSHKLWQIYIFRYSTWKIYTENWKTGTAFVFQSSLDEGAHLDVQFDKFQTPPAASSWSSLIVWQLLRFRLLIYGCSFVF